MILTVILSALMNAYLLSQLNSFEKQIGGGGGNNLVKVVPIQVMLLSQSFTPLTLLFPTASWVKPIFYGLLGVSPILGYAASVGHKNQLNTQVGSERTIESLPFGLHKNPFFIKSVIFLSANFSYLSLAVYFISLGLMILSLGSTPFVVATTVALLANQAYQHNWLPKIIEKTYIWIMNLVCLSAFFGVGNWFSVSLTVLFIGHTLWNFIQINVRGTKSNSILFPLQNPETQLKLDDLSQKPTNQNTLNKLIAQLRNYEFQVTYNHFSQVTNVVSKMLKNTPNVDVENYIKIFSELDFNDPELRLLIESEMTNQDKFHEVDLDSRKKELSLPKETSVYEIYVAYLKKEMKCCVDRLYSTHSRDMPQERFLLFQKQARSVLNAIETNFKDHKKPCSRTLIEIALRTGSHCNQAYVDTFGEIFERQYFAAKTVELSLQERTVLAAQSFREECFRRYYYKSIKILRELNVVFDLLYKDANSYDSYENFLRTFGRNFHLRNVLFELQVKTIINEASEYWLHSFLKLYEFKLFDEYYHKDTLVDEVLTPGKYLHTLFKEWCDTLYPKCAQDFIYDENNYLLDIKNDRSIRKLAEIMLADLGILQLNKPYQKINLAGEKAMSDPTPPHHTKSLWQPLPNNNLNRTCMSEQTDPSPEECFRV